MARVMMDNFEGPSLSSWNPINPPKPIPNERIVHLFKIAMDIVALFEKEKVQESERPFVMEQVRTIQQLKERL